jgi:BirA family biotin operon repressor/biotin-[acetyl-CoA-carboxylase] ligase
VKANEVMGGEVKGSEVKGAAKGTPPPLARGGQGEGAERTSLLMRARVMRRTATPAERKLWQVRRGHRLGGLKFRRQIPLGPYIADFYCASARLVIEVDGVSHFDAPGDAGRDAWMAKHGIRIHRVSNRDVLSNVAGIPIEIGQLAAPPPPTPLPQGEGESTVDV